MTKREEYGVVLDFLPNGKAGMASKESIAQLLGDSYFTLLEVVVKPGASLAQGTRVYVGRGERSEIDHIKGRVLFNDLTNSAQAEAKIEIPKLVLAREADFVGFLNRAGALNIRTHSLELLPSIGKRHLDSIITARDLKPFASFADVHDRVGSLGKVEDIFTNRIIEELRGDSKYYLFTKPPASEDEPRR
jgi:putative nucleotide binding protein